mmetsp:Transcript_37213/g.105035  ORF Transcript_37213/g.105035 Transcript_37213/m.105035 type:complete len:277 (-) Transcript_37213:437-1267(-)
MGASSSVWLLSWTATGAGALAAGPSSASGAVAGAGMGAAACGSDAGGEDPASASASISAAGVPGHCSGSRLPSPMSCCSFRWLPSSLCWPAYCAASAAPASVRLYLVPLLVTQPTSRSRMLEDQGSYHCPGRPAARCSLTSGSRQRPRSALSATSSSLVSGQPFMCKATMIAQPPLNGRHGRTSFGGESTADRAPSGLPAPAAPPGAPASSAAATLRRFPLGPLAPLLRLRVGRKCFAMCAAISGAQLLSSFTSRVSMRGRNASSPSFVCCTHLRS